MPSLHASKRKSSMLPEKLCCAERLRVSVTTADKQIGVPRDVTSEPQGECRPGIVIRGHFAPTYLRETNQPMNPPTMTPSVNVAAIVSMG
jgi:hypothetical protein